MPFLPLISTFGDDDIESIFSARTTIETWLDVERTLATVQGELGLIPLDAAEAIERELDVEDIDLDRLLQRTRVVGYPILPLIEQVTENSSPLVRSYLHWGATTQDVMDTGLVLQARQGLDRVEQLTLTIGDDLVKLARDYRSVLIAARTHGQQAVPTTFGAKVAIWLDEFRRHVERVQELRPRLLVVQLFGAAGTAAALGSSSHEVRRRVAEKLGLERTDVPWHTARDNLAELGFVLAAIAATCGKVALEVVELSRSEISEVREAEDGDGRGASSTMPQKGNPILSEATRGMAAQARQHVGALLDAMEASHERSAGEWQIEWDSLPMLFGLTCGSLAAISNVIDALRVFPDRMRANMQADNGLLMAEAVMIALAPIIGRLQAHEVIASACLAARAQDLPLRQILPTVLSADLLDSVAPLDDLLSPENYLGEAEAIVDAATTRWVATYVPADPQP